MQIGTIEGLLKLRDEFSGVLDRAANNLDRVGDRMTRALDAPVKHSGRIVAAITASAGLLVKAVFDATADAEAKMAQLEAGVASTGHAAGLSARQIADMAGRLEDLTGVEDEVVMGAQGILLTFRKVHKDAFEPATRAALDLSRRGFGDLNTTIKMVGKTLEDPIRGITALRRAGVQFTEGQQRVLKSLVETNQLAEAQAMILRELEIQVGGSAEAFRNTLPGALAALKAEWSNVLEKIGEDAGGGGIFRTSIESMVRGLQWLQENWHLLESATFIVLGNISERS